MKATYFFICYVLLSFSIQAQTFIRSELPTVVSTPWEIIYGPDNYLWITEDGGRVSRVDPATGNKVVVYTAPDYFAGSPLENSPFCTNKTIGTGTLGMALHPDFLIPAKAFIYFVYSYNSGTAQSPATKFRIKRLKWNPISNSVVGDSNIVNLITTGYDHLGGRLLAAKQNGIPYLFLAVGDHGISEQNAPTCYVPQSTNPNNFTQDVTTQNGKIHRFAMDGSVPPDNPIPGNSYYTRGHRNPQGLMFNPNLDLIYDIEHGDRTDDEINVLQKGMNYGWKDVRGFHGDSSFSGEAAYVANYLPNPLIANDALIEPLFAWCTSPSTSSNWTDWCTVAPSGGEYYNSNAIAQWQNSLLVVTLKDGLSTNMELYQFKLQANGDLETSTPQNPNPKKFFGSEQTLNGRLRDIAVSNDGQTIYLVNNGGGGGDKITVYQYDNTTTIQDYSGQLLNIEIFPNPTNGLLTLKGIKDLSAIEDIHISSLLGKNIEVQLNSNFQVDVSGFVNGIHFIHFRLDSYVYTLKFVKF